MGARPVLQMELRMSVVWVAQLLLRVVLLMELRMSKVWLPQLALLTDVLEAMARPAHMVGRV
ncbi:hypothetical protein DYH55_16350 [Methylovirgula sp. 4M-Z18]|nr:hypothetical protein DYH55_16350 [Methylovirgula sp. 4M-Z18]